MNWIDEIACWKQAGKKVVFTNGVFDILHVGHVDYLAQARSLGDVLVVGLNADDSVRLLGKGPDRPINPDWARQRVLESLQMVNRVVVFADSTPLKLIKAINPDVLVKGGDYDVDEENPDSSTYIVGSDHVKSKGGVVKVIPLVKGFSTTQILKKKG